MDAVDSARFLRPPSPQRSGSDLPLVLVCAACVLLVARAGHNHSGLFWSRSADAVVAPAPPLQHMHPALSLDLDRAHRTRTIA